MTSYEIQDQLRTHLANSATAYNLVRDDDGQVSLVLRDRRRDPAANTMQEYIGAGAIEPQPAQLHMLEEAWQRRTMQADLSRFMVELQAEAGLDQGEDAGACPGLRCTGDGVQGRSGAPARKAAEQLGQSPRLPVACRLEQAGEDPQHRVLQTISRQA